MIPIRIQPSGFSGRRHATSAPTPMNGSMIAISGTANVQDEWVRSFRTICATVRATIAARAGRDERARPAHGRKGGHVVSGVGAHARILPGRASRERYGRGRAGQLALAADAN